MKIAVIGSRGLNRIDCAKIGARQGDVIVSGGARGVDSIAATWARRKGLGVIEYKPSYARYFRSRRKATTLLCVGLYHKMNPVESEHSIAWELPETQPESEALPDLPTENVAQFIGRMNRDFDLTKI